LHLQAYACYLEAIRIDPQFAIAWSNLAGLFMEVGDLNKAMQYYKVNITSAWAFGGNEKYLLVCVL
jgi:protein O-GlcNAc transferase